MAKLKKKAAYQNRVKELRIVSASELQANPNNFRTHGKYQRDVLKGALAEVGIAGALIAYEHPERGLELIDGHMRASEGGQWPVLILDVTEEEAQKLLLTYDPITGLADQNNEILSSLLQSVDITNDALLSLVNDMASALEIPDDAMEHWQGMPDYSFRKPHFKSIQVHFADQAAIDNFCKLLGVVVNPATTWIHYPETIIIRTEKAVKSNAKT